MPEIVIQNIPVSHPIGTFGLENPLSDIRCNPWKNKLAPAQNKAKLTSLKIVATFMRIMKTSIYTRKSIYK